MGNRYLERNVSAYFDCAERLLEDETLLGMNDFANSIDEFLKFNRYKVLEGHGSITRNVPVNKAIGEYKEFNKHQKYSLISIGRLKKYKERKDE